MRRSLAVLTACALLLLTACGGDEGTDAPADSGGDRLSKADFISQGDAICADLETKGDALGTPASEEEVGPFIREAVTLAQGAREQLAALNPPEDGEQVQQELLDSLDRAIETAEEAATAAEDGDTVAAGDLLSEASELGDAADAAAQEYGFEECGTSSDDASAAGEPLSKEDYVAQADAVCLQLVEQLEAVADPAGEEDLARFLSEVAAVTDATRAQLAELAPPADGEQVHQEVLDSLDTYSESYRGAVQAAESGDTVTASDLAQQAPLPGSANAEAYGIPSCSNATE